jgi:hypothetical protein
MSSFVTTAFANIGEVAPARNVTVRVCRTWAEVERLAPAWRSWPGHRDTDMDVYRTVVDSMGGGATPYIVVVERRGQAEALLIGISSIASLPIKVAYLTFPVRGVRMLTFVYGGFLGDHSDENSRALVGALTRGLQAGHADVALLRYVRSDSTLYQCARDLPPRLMRDHFPVTQRHWRLSFSHTADCLYAGLSAKHRGNLRRDAKKFRAAFNDNIEVKRLDGADQLESLILEVETVAATTYQRGLGVGFSTSSHVRNLLALEARKGWLRGYVLYADGRPCAFLIGCVREGVFLNEYFGHDPAFSKYSPGTYLFLHVLEELSRERVSEFDFGIGEAFYKERFANEGWDEGSLLVYAPTFKGMQAQIGHIVGSVISVTAKRVLERTGLTARIKKLWRSRLGRQAAATQSHS